MKDRTVKWVQCGGYWWEGGKVNEGDSSEGIWLMDFIYL
jgi:hypothetical protein